MDPAFAIEYAPAFELLVSLAVYGERSRWKSMDLGRAWGAEVEKRIGPDGRAALGQIHPLRDVQPLFVLVSQAPGQRTAAGFIDWLAALSPGELYERVFCQADEKDRADLPGDLVAWRDQMLPRLRLWHARYFQHLDPAIGAHLMAEAEARRAQAAFTPVMDLVAEATNGLYLDPAEPLPMLLVPQYHMRPWNLCYTWRNLRVILYPVEPMHANPDEPPLPLTRMARALSDENRLRILRFLARTPLNLSELTERTGLAKSTVHHHMVMLRAAGLVILHQKGCDGRYALRPGWLDLVRGRLSGFVADQ